MTKSSKATAHDAAPSQSRRPPGAPARLGKTVALVGLMGAGKTTVGRRLAEALKVPFVDADHEIEVAAGRTVSDIFDSFGEAAFRDGERRVIARLLDDPPHILATGGGAFIDPATRSVLKARAITVWLQADVEVLARRVSRRDTRPLLRGKSPRDVLEALLRQREPIYRQADLTVMSQDGPHDRTVQAVLDALAAHAQTPQAGSLDTPPSTPKDPP